MLSSKQENCLLAYQAASPWCVRSVILVTTVRHLAGQGASRHWVRSVSLHMCTIAVVAVLRLLQFSKSFSHTLKILLYLYINIELNFDFRTIYFGTATTATLQQRVQSDRWGRFCHFSHFSHLSKSKMDCQKQALYINNIIILFIYSELCFRSRN